MRIGGIAELGFNDGVSRRVALLVALLALSIGAVLLLCSGEAGVPGTAATGPSSVSPAPDPATAMSSQGGAGLPESPSATTRDAFQVGAGDALDPALTTGYRGRVVTAQGQPVGGMTVRLLRGSPDLVVDFVTDPFAAPVAVRIEAARDERGVVLELLGDVDLGGIGLHARISRMGSKAGSAMGNLRPPISKLPFDFTPSARR